jgi:predicted RNase H-like HicB family nuclease
MTIKAVVHRAEEGGYWAEVPALPGCVTQADQYDELLANIREVVELYLSVAGEEAEKQADGEVVELTV